MAMQYRGYGTDDIFVLDFIASHCPDNPNVPAFLQEIFHGAENRFESPGKGKFFVDDPDFAVYVVPCLKAAKSDIDRFLDARGYIDNDYLYEHLGTRYLRAQNYARAVEILSKVSPDYKLAFARQMLRYQKESMSSDPDKAGLAMTMMGIGLRSSFSFCWTLTQYHLYTDDEWQEDDITKMALSKAEKLMNTGKELVRDHELAARISVMLCQWGRAVTLYPETMTAEMVRTQCDTYKDYR